MTPHNPQPFSNPYLAGIGLGLVLLASFLIVGRGLGASGAMTRTAVYAVEKTLPDVARENSYMKDYLGELTHTLDDFLVYMLIGAFAGGIISGALSGRIYKEIIHGPNASPRTRLILAFAGGIVSAIGARLARGCTSGQALTGGATLAVGSWVFMIAVFAGGYALAYFTRRQWL